MVTLNDHSDSIVATNIAIHCYWYFTHIILIHYKILQREITNLLYSEKLISQSE